MPVLAAAASLLDIGTGLLNIGDAYARARQKRAALRRMRLLEEQANAWQEQIYGRTLDELGDYFGGREGGAGQLSRISTEQRIGEGMLRGESGAVARSIQGRRQTVNRSLARRGVSGGAVATTLAQLETDISSEATARGLDAMNSARGQRVAFAQGYRGPTSRAAELEAGLVGQGISADARGIGQGLESLALLTDGEREDVWAQAMREGRRRRRQPIQSSETGSGFGGA